MKKSTIILIVDDETNIRLMLRTALSTGGCEIHEAVDGVSGVNAVKLLLPDVLILDLSMPNLDGLGVLRELSALRIDHKPRVIVLTAYGTIPMAVKAMRLGAMDFLEKPVSPDEIREAIEAVLAETVVSEKPVQNDPLAGGYEAVLDRIRKSLRLAKYTDAETLLMKVADLAHKDAAYFNLLGVMYESQREWRVAGKFYKKALSENKHYEPALENLRRLQQLKSAGRSTSPVMLGDEADLLYARMPQDANN